MELNRRTIMAGAAAAGLAAATATGGTAHAVMVRLFSSMNHSVEEGPRRPAGPDGTYEPTLRLFHTSKPTAASST
ncbi:hypothetical protein JTP67_14825, partial [Streptomyces sp. S12]|nr:hypothetical protein [Streptomyces sp. S12]